jgi:hypothetical protein
MSEIHLCPAMTHPGSFWVDATPPEFCDAEVDEPGDYCPKHEEHDD